MGKLLGILAISGLAYYLYTEWEKEQARKNYKPGKGVIKHFQTTQAKK